MKTVASTSSGSLSDILTVGFSDILPLWKKLWDNRASAIEPINGMLYLGGYDESILTNKATFWAVLKDQTPIACVSGFSTSITNYRCRGLFVENDYRGLGLSLKLLNAAISKARKLNHQRVWSLPRKSAFFSYRNAGFTRSSNWINDRFEFGPNCYAELKI